MFCALVGRTRRRRLHARNPDDAALEAANSKQREQPLAEDNFRRAMSVFDVACMAHVQQGSYLSGQSLASSFPPCTICSFVHDRATLLSTLPFVYIRSIACFYNLPQPVAHSFLLLNRRNQTKQLGMWCLMRSDKHPFWINLASRISTSHLILWLNAPPKTSWTPSPYSQ